MIIVGTVVTSRSSMILGFINATKASNRGRVELWDEAVTSSG
jgi:hypothetical protein